MDNLSLINGVSKIYTMATTEHEWIHEAELAKWLAVPRTTVSESREQFPPEAVKKTAAGWMWRSDAASSLAMSLHLVLDLPEKKTAPADTSELLTVIRSAPNRIIVYARRSDGSEVQVRVKDNTRYVPIARDGKPMTFRAQPDGTGTGKWWRKVGPEPHRGVSQR